MAKKSPTGFSASQRNILNFKPDIHYVEPEQIEDEKLPEPPKAPSLDQLKTDATDLIEEYKAVEAKAEEIQEEINDKAAGLVINLDPNQDAFVIEAVQRHFNDPNKTSITYDDYINCINEVNEAGAAQATTVDPNDVAAAATDQYRDAFGSLGMPSGMARPELAPHAQTIKPLNMGQFKGEQLLKLLDLLTPGINKMIIDKIKEVVPF